MNETLTLRSGTAADAAAMLSVARTLPEWFNDQGILEMAQDFQSHQALIAVDASEEAAEVAGFITWAPSPHTPEEGLMEITWLGVRPSHQGRGVGRMLVKSLAERCRQEGISVLQVSTLADSVDYPPYAATRAFYRTLGFKDWRVDPAFYGPDADRLLLRLAL